MKNCVVRTFANNYTSTTKHLNEKLEQGWIVKMAVPFTKANGSTELVEYILEKEE